MRLLVVTHNYPRFPGDPSGAFVARIAERAATMGGSVRVLAPHAPGTAREETINGVFIRRFRYAPDRLERVAYTGDLHRGSLRSPGVAAAFPGFVWAFRRAIRRELRTVAPDVVHTHWWLPSGFLVAGLAPRFLVTCHGSDVALLHRGVFRVMAGRVFRRATGVTTVSRFLAEELTKRFPWVQPKLQVLPMPVDSALFSTGRAQPKRTPPIILFAGNLVPMKGVDVLLRAVAQLRAANIPCRVRILGEGPSEAELRDLAARLGLLDTEWSPFVPQDRMPAEYGASTITVLPSRGRSEGLGLTLVEALLAGASVIGSAVGGIPEVVEDRVTGLLVREGDADDLARALRELLQDGTLRDRFSDAGRARVATIYGAETAADAFLELYARAGHG